MLLDQVSYNGTHPMGHYLYIYISNKKNIKYLAPILSKYKTINIQITTLVLDNVIDSLIMPKKHSEKNN